MTVSPAARAELDRAFSPSSLVPDFRSVLDRCRQASERARETLRCTLDVPYGNDPAERLDVFPPGHPGAPLLAFVHGGHWQELGKEDSAFAAADLVREGAGVVVVDYGLAPAYRLGEIVGQVDRALRWVRAHSRDLGGLPGGVYAAGSSAGAHLVAMALCEPDPPVAGACLLSGLYDLRELRHSYVNDALRLNAAAAAAYSPLFRTPAARPEVLLARGERETREYARQHRLARDWLPRAEHLVVAGRNHFDLPEDLGRRHTVLGATVLRQLRLR